MNTKSMIAVLSALMLVGSAQARYFKKFEARTDRPSLTRAEENSYYEFLSPDSLTAYLLTSASSRDPQAIVSIRCYNANRYSLDKNKAESYGYYYRSAKGDTDYHCYAEDKGGFAEALQQSNVTPYDNFTVQRTKDFIETINAKFIPTNQRNR